MNAIKCSRAFIALIFVSVMLLLSGCATTGMDRSVNTSNSIHEVDLEIKKMTTHIDGTSSALESLFLAGEPDLKKHFQDYTGNLKNLNAQGALLIKRVDEMKASSMAYFAEWEKQGDVYTNPQIRQLSAERRAKLAAIYARVPEAGAGIKGAYLNSKTNLNEIQLYLSTDLTVGGVQAIRPVAQQAIQDLDALRNSIQPIVVALEEINLELYGSGK